MRRQHAVKNAVAAHIGVGQHVVTDGLRLTQAAAVADHQPAMRAQHGQVVGDVLGVGRTDADVDQGDAVAVIGLQVIGRHLVAVPDHVLDDRLHLAFGHATLDHHVARQHHAAEARVAHQHVQAVADELVDVTVIVGQQDPRLHMAPVTAGVVLDALEREVGARCVEQCQRQWVDVLPVVQTIGGAVGGGGQIGAGEYPCQLGGGHTTAGQLIAALDHVRVGNVLLAAADFHTQGEVVH